jgi:hypothetical protein
MQSKPDCNVCKRMHKKNETIPPCKDCIPELLESNIEAFEVFPMIRNQVILAGMDGKVVDLNFGSLEFIFNLFNIKNRKDCFTKIYRMFHYFLENR